MQNLKLAVIFSLSLAVSGWWLPEGNATGSLGQSAIARQPELLVATTRRGVGAQAPWFNAQRGESLTTAQAQLNPPPNSLVSRAAALVTGDWRVARVEALAEGDKAPQAFAKEVMGRDVLLYVHGYRETFESAAVSAAQLSDGVQFQGATALFAWPSGGATFDYAYDRESAMWSRDALEDLLLALAESPSGGKVHIVAHSMGTLLTLETLRLLRARGGDSIMAKIGAVVLASPDIDIDIFTRGVERLGPYARKITVITASNDRALELSRRLAGGVMRAGAADRDKLAALGVRVADATDFGSGVFNHDLFLRNDDVRAVVRRAIERER